MAHQVKVLGTKPEVLGPSLEQHAVRREPTPISWPVTPIHMPCHELPTLSTE